MDYKNTPVINVDELTILDYAGHNRIPIGGEYYINFFADKLIEEWIPYFECHQCGRGDYCKFTVPKPNNSYRKEDIKCGIAATSIKNFIKYTWMVFEKLDKKHKQKYLDGLYHFLQYIYKTEQNIGMFLDEDMLKHFENSVPSIFGNIHSLRSDLNNFVHFFKDIPEFKVKKGILLVEGWSEKMFLQRIFEGGYIWSHRFDIEVYEGTSNKSPKKLQLLLSKLRNDGYKIYIQGDKDGKDIDMFQEHKKRNLLNEASIFQFKQDFETAFPPKLMFYILNDLELITEVEYEDFFNKLYPCEGGIVRKIMETFNINPTNFKMLIADKAAKILNYTDWWNKEEIINSELGKFLSFVKKI